MSGDHGVLAGPFTVDGPGEIAVAARPIGGDTIPATTALPDPERLGKADEQVCAAAQNTKVALNATIREALAGLGDFWEERARAFATRQQTQLALSIRVSRELKGLAEDSPEFRAIAAQYDPKFKVLEAEQVAANRAVGEVEAADSDLVAPGPFTFGDQEASLRQQLDALRKTLLQDAADYVRKAERIVARRQARYARLDNLLRAVREAAAALPPPDEKLWATQATDFAARGEALFATALADAPVDDTPAFAALAAELDAFFGAQAAVCSDQRPEPQRKPNAYSAFIDADRTLLELANYQDFPEGWSDEVRTTGWTKVERRNRATGAMLGLRNSLQVRQLPTPSSVVFHASPAHPTKSGGLSRVQLSGNRA